VAQAARWAQTCGLRVDAPPEHVRSEHLTLARVLLGQGEVAGASALLERLGRVAKAGGQMGQVIEVLLLHALALQATERREDAVRTLQRALELAAPAGYVRLFADEGVPMGRLLRQVRARGWATGDAASAPVHAAYLERLLAALPATAPAPRTVPRPLLAEPLTRRESDVLRRIAAGLTNQEIAGELVVSVSTVKTHINNIYGKLGVHTRTQAVAQGQAVGVL
jgi:LuxR family maltose regulon positive regulatory protein